MKIWVMCVVHLLSPLMCGMWAWFAINAKTQEIEIFFHLTNAQHTHPCMHAHTFLANVAYATLSLCKILYLSTQIIIIRTQYHRRFVGLSVYGRLVPQRLRTYSICERCCTSKLCKQICHIFIPNTFATSFAHVFSEFARIANKWL